MNKLASKVAFRAAGVPTPAYLPFSAEDPTDRLLTEAGELGYPLVVKPGAQGSSIGVHIVRQPEGLRTAVEDALSYGKQGLLEPFIAGRELTVGILDGEPLPVIELRPAHEFFDYEAKYQPGLTEHVFDVSLSPACYRQVQEAALAAYEVLGCQGFARVDMRLSQEAEPYVLELNTIPGFTPTSLFPEAARRRGIEFPELCHRLVELALRDCPSSRHAGMTTKRGG